MMLKRIPTTVDKKLDRDTLSHVLSFLDLEDLREARQVNRKFRACVNSYLSMGVRRLERPILLGPLRQGVDTLSEWFDRPPPQPKEETRAWSIKRWLSCFFGPEPKKTVIADKTYRFAAKWDWFDQPVDGIVEVIKENKHLHIDMTDLGPLQHFMCHTSREIPIRFSDGGGLEFRGRLRSGRRRFGCLLSPEGNPIYDGPWHKDRPAIHPSQFPLKVMDSDGQEYGYFSNGIVSYQGGVLNRAAHGVGTKIDVWPRWKAYWGDFEDGFPHGKGRQLMVDFDNSLILSEGAWDHGKLQGEGESKHFMDDRLMEWYVGDFVGGVRQGQGQLSRYEAYEDYYEGSFHQGKRHGFGGFAQRNSDNSWNVSEGYWKEDDRHGPFKEYKIKANGRRTRPRQCTYPETLGIGEIACLGFICGALYTVNRYMPR